MLLLAESQSRPVLIQSFGTRGLLTRTMADRQGYPTDRFVNGREIDEFLCPVCLDVVRDCVETKACGHLFCAPCIARLATFECPVCQADTTSGVQPVAYLRRRVGGLSVRCKYYKERMDGQAGCTETFALREEPRHLAVCAFEPVRCRCGESMERRLLTIHEAKSCRLRAAACPQCHTVRTLCSVGSGSVLVPLGLR